MVDGARVARVQADLHTAGSAADPSRYAVVPPPQRVRAVLVTEGYVTQTACYAWRLSGDTSFGARRAPVDETGDSAVPGTGDWVEQVPLEVVPDEVSVTIGDLGFAGRYLPAGQGAEPIAGDFYDLVPLGPDLIAIVVGDVAGHGPAALARMLQLRAATRAYAIETPGPADVLTRLDRFCTRLDPESIATIWYGEYQPSTGTLSYAAAGHPPPVLVSPAHQTRLLAPADAPPLGTGSVDTVPVQFEVLPVGAVLVAYSDGLVERYGADYELQLAILQEAVAAATHPARRRTTTEVAAHILETLIPDPKYAQDDVCLLVVRREEGRSITL
jgi:hypothetical protein